MKLIADGGSTKVDWCLVGQDGLVKRVFSKGANPIFRDTADISAELKEVLTPEMAGYTIDSVHFYGAGCALPEKIETVRLAIADALSLDASKIEVGSDMLGAAIGMFGNKPGIACIIGTGSNSCYYDGEKITANVSPGGFILGDEGSGAVLGRLFIGAVIKNQFPEEMKARFFDFIGITYPEIIEKVYRQPLPNKFLATVSPFIKENLNNEAVYNLVYNSFADFFKRNVMQYEYKGNKVSLIGSVAYHYEDVLKKVAIDLGVEIGVISQSPMDGMIEHFKK